MTPTLRLSSSARSRIDWSRINDATLGARARGDTDAADADPKKIHQVFTVAKQEFQVALASLRRLVALMSWLVGLAAAVAVAGLVLFAVFDARVPGAVTCGVSLTSLVALVVKMWQLGRDQAMLELIPTRYEIALSFATSNTQLSEILTKFLTETESLRG